MSLADLARRPLNPPLVLAVDLAEPAVDPPPASLIEKAAGARGPALKDLLDTLEDAATDAKVHSLVIRVGNPAMDWAVAEELRGAIKRFRASGRRVVAHAETFGEQGEAHLAYYVASACDEVHLQPSGALPLVGVALEALFVRGLLDKLDVDPQVGHRREYKSAKNMLTETEFTEAHRESLDRIVASLSEQLAAAVADGRGMTADAVARVIDGGPYLAEDAVQAGLVDRLCYRDETVRTLKDAAGEHAVVRTWNVYRAARKRRPRLPVKQTRVALIHGRGGIQLGRSRPAGLMGPVMGADTVVKAFRTAINDKSIKAILFRVNSPGGSAVASDAILREVVRARNAGKPVVVSMGAIAGSGGYWIAMDADKIIAAPGTLTGSIGVVMGKLVTRKIWERLGVTSESVQRGENARMYSPKEGFTDEQWAKNDEQLDEIYELFVNKAAAGRNLDSAEVEPHARGRVWTGADAHERGLIDDLGGYHESLAAIRELLELDTDAKLNLVTLPKTGLAERFDKRSPELTDAARLLIQAGEVTGRIRAQAGTRGASARMTDF